MHVLYLVQSLDWCRYFRGKILHQIEISSQFFLVFPFYFFMIFDDKGKKEFFWIIVREALILIDWAFDMHITCNIFNFITDIRFESFMKSFLIQSIKIKNFQKKIVVIYKVIFFRGVMFFNSPVLLTNIFFSSCSKEF